MHISLTLTNNSTPTPLFNYPPISIPSTYPRYNFSVKYVKADTGTIEVDGIKAASLDMKGEMAYGKGWVVLCEDPSFEGTRPKAQSSSIQQAALI